MVAVCVSDRTDGKNARVQFPRICKARYAPSHQTIAAADRAPPLIPSVPDRRIGSRISFAVAFRVDVKNDEERRFEYNRGVLYDWTFIVKEPASVLQCGGLEFVMDCGGKLLCHSGSFLSFHTHTTSPAVAPRRPLGLCTTFSYCSPTSTPPRLTCSPRDTRPNPVQPSSTTAVSRAVRRGPFPWSHWPAGAPDAEQTAGAQTGRMMVQSGGGGLRV